MNKANFKIGNIDIGLDAPLFVIAGPCVIESKNICLDIADKLVKIAASSGVGMIFKASFDKANRSSLHSFRGPGLAGIVSEVVDCLQVPAFLCRQTDLLCACGRTGKPVNIKKGQFLSPDEMKNAVEKVRACGNSQILLTERGTFFGYNRLVNDMTAIDTMKKLGCPVVFDATHSVQQPGGLGDASAGRQEMAPILAKAAVAAGANGLFIEVHTDPEKAKSDAASIMPIDWLEDLLEVCKKIFEVVRK
jgi:2-dehydro-3-deoxyphosphooctonate aldolase (KDO 8-P synthase)